MDITTITCIYFRKEDVVSDNTEIEKFMQELTAIAIIVVIIACVFMFGFTHGDIVAVHSYDKHGKTYYYVEFTSVGWTGKKYTWYAKCKSDQKSYGSISRWNVVSNPEYLK